MRHKAMTGSLGRFSSFRKATIKSIVISVLVHQRIVTTKVKAKSARRAVDRVITLGKKDSLSARRRAFSLLCDHKLVKTLFDQIAPIFTNRTGGYTRIIPYRYQRGDNAQMVILELTQRYKEKKAEKPTKETKELESAVTKKQKPEVSKEEKDIQFKPEIKEKVIEKEEPIKTEAKEKKEEPGQEKPHSHPEEDKQKKPEPKKAKRLFKGFKGFFKKKRDAL